MTKIEVVFKRQRHGLLWWFGLFALICVGYAIYESFQQESGKTRENKPATVDVGRGGE